MAVPSLREPTRADPHGRAADSPSLIPALARGRADQAGGPSGVPGMQPRVTFSSAAVTAGWFAQPSLEKRPGGR
jgi:hypothetical protein